MKTVPNSHAVRTALGDPAVGGDEHFACRVSGWLVKG